VTTAANDGSGSSGSPSRRTLIASSTTILLLSVVAAWYALVRPVWGMIAARGWVQHECEIVSSGIDSRYTRNSSGKSSLSHSLAVVYRYEYAGDLYRPSHRPSAPAVVFVSGYPDPGLVAMLGKPLKDWSSGTRATG